MSAFYDCYVRLCALKGVSLSRAAESVGLSRTSPNGWKKGKMPSDVTLAKLANYFGCTVEDLIGEAKKPTVKDDELNPELINLLSSLTPGQIANVTAYIQGMLSK